ncbi:SWIM zinc finger family protein [Caulobacter sp. KR2-114]|uniref:SWIM zinc finger family protein n=1 Tax=Caulobacter sp. KR2-114 TaxID=3400912 RepID=UPI003C0345DF
MRFDAGDLRRIAGQATYERGEAYHRQGLVQVLEMTGERVLAKVEGTQDYRTVVTDRGGRISGECSCPAFEDRGFCKHMVAVALSADEAERDPAARRDSPLPRIREHLRAQGVEALVELVVRLAERDRDLFRRLDTASAITGADDKALEARLVEAIDAAMDDGPEYVDYQAAPDFAAGLHEVLDTLEALLPAGRAGMALRLTERMLDAFEDVLENVDDSDGECGGALARTEALHLAAARAEPPQPVAFAQALFERETTSGFDVFSDAAMTYADVLGPAGLAEYRRLALEAWETAPSRKADDGAGPSAYAVEGILEAFARRDGDVDLQRALYSRDLSSPDRYLRLAEFCLSLGQRDEALRHARDALWMFEDRRPNERLVRFTADLLGHMGRPGEAGALLWETFRKIPNRDLYDRLRQLEGDAGGVRALQWLQDRLAGRSEATWNHPADLLVELLSQEGLFDRAWAVVGAHGASEERRLALAQATEASHPREVIALYVELVDRRAQTSSGDYTAAARLVARLASLQGPAEHAEYLAALKERFKRRRNFMTLLA